MVRQIGGGDGVVLCAVHMGHLGHITGGSIAIISKFSLFLGTFDNGGENISFNEYLMQVKCFYVYDHGLEHH